MSLNTDLNKQAQEVIFSRKLRKVFHPLLRFNINVSHASSQKHLGLTFDNSFHKHLTKLSKISKTIGLLQKLHFLQYINVL